ncbi:phosphate signaling complex protein PhoU [Kiloniella laminariae]|uniref:Phosphate-specific transport system accessory protein PhoU n=1 Tax=Kiloniella laminariae TaxID=454162 RepID=A0ABT4LJI0_9PROT|nr:phosphate signaling complex protein PhoU [Kiloniella laminariae]MCZ4281263.1 phosphate signaling complex protein PhoU [Kiloniella laminariae]
MQNSNDHIVRSFDKELRTIHEIIIRMGGMAENQLAEAVDALVQRDSAKAEMVRAEDAKIDALEEELEAAVVQLIALRQPVANDLRAVISALKISSDLERIGDYAKNIAKRSIAINQMPPQKSVTSIMRMSRLVQEIVKDTLDAFSHSDKDRAIDVWHRDEEVDEMYTSLFRELLTYMMEDPRNIGACTHMLFIAKNIERMGDHATNIAETIYYLSTGHKLEGKRPKGDRTPFQILSAEEDNGEVEI